MPKPDDPRPEHADDSFASALSAALQAREAIRRQIARLELAPGDMVSERELSEAVGFGRTAVREALQGLVTDGLVTPRVGSGYLVTPITFAGTRKLFAMWRVVEPGALDVASRQAGALRPGLVRQLVSRASEASTASELPELDACVLREMAFHTALVSTSQNRWLTRAFLAAAVELERVIRFASRLGADFTHADDDHEPLLAALTADSRSPESRRACVEHIDRLELIVVDAFMNSDVNLAVAPGVRRHDDEAHHAADEWSGPATGR